MEYFHFYKVFLEGSKLINISKDLINFIIHSTYKMI